MDQERIKQLKIVLQGIELALRLAADPSDAAKVVDALKALKALYVTLEEMKKEAPEPLRVLIEHFLKLLVKNIVLIEAGKPTLSMTREFSLLYSVVDKLIF